MFKLLRIFFWGLMISFIGSLPLGTLNVAAMQLGIYENITNAILFSFGSLLVEMIYVRISLVGINWINKQKKLMDIMQWITFGIVVVLAFASFYAALQTNANTENAGVNPYRNIGVNRFLLGMGLCAINPVQIPFWFGWSTVLFSKKILEPINSQYNIYIVGIGLGTLAGNCVFIFGGKYLVSRIANSQQYLNWVIGGIFAITALITLWKILNKKPSELAD
ncbi:MAG: LysE family transporter [Ferruginibacter sp.]|nr:LysE family transporter [Ferruginibacter sp.]